MLGGFIAAAVIFGAALWFHTDDAAARLAAQQEMVDDAPNQFREGQASNLLSGGSVDNVTGRHPAYLLGAIAAAAGSSVPCSAANMRVDTFTARCVWNGGSFIIYGATMPVLLTRQRMGPNKFDDDGRPMLRDGRRLDNPVPYDQQSATELRLEYRYGLYNNLNTRIAELFTGVSALPLGNSGVWLSGNPSLGYRTCHYYRYRSLNGSTDGITLTCYQS